MTLKESSFIESGAWKILAIGIPLLIGLMLSLYFFVQVPQEQYLNKVISDDNRKSKAEHDKIVVMGCKSLGNWLTQDSWYDRDNLIWAQNHYLVNCK